MPRPELSDRAIIEQSIGSRLASAPVDSPRATSFFDMLAFRLTYARIGETAGRLNATKGRSDRKQTAMELESLLQRQRDISTRIEMSRKKIPGYKTEHDTWSNWLTLAGEQFVNIATASANVVFGEELVTERLGLEPKMEE